MNPEIFLNALRLNRTDALIEEVQRRADQRIASADATRRLEEIRAISNVAQALENLITQCGGAPRFAELQERSESEWVRTCRDLQRKVHEPASDGCY